MTCGKFDPFGISPQLLCSHEVNSVLLFVRIEFKVHSGIILIPYRGAKRLLYWVSAERHKSPAMVKRSGTIVRFIFLLTHC